MSHDREDRRRYCHCRQRTPGWGFLPQMASSCLQHVGQHSKVGQQDPGHSAPPYICSQPSNGSEGETPSPEGLVSQEVKGRKREEEEEVGKKEEMSGKRRRKRKRRGGRRKNRGRGRRKEERREEEGEERGQRRRKEKE